MNSRCDITSLDFTAAILERHGRYHIWYQMEAIFMCIALKYVMGAYQVDCGLILYGIYNFTNLVEMAHRKVGNNC